jgi:Zn-dependent protease with chaperone function
LNFFDAQDKARKNTTWLISLFIIAIAVLIIFTNCVLFLILYWIAVYFDASAIRNFDFSYDMLQSLYPLELLIAMSIGVCLLVLTGSMLKSIALSGGGPIVARMLGARLVPIDTTALKLRRLLNVVEEMAIAAGMPIPKVYLLDDLSINAFAAGRSPTNAVIGITWGSLVRLNREELQAVIAHEFSHILNGDMLLNLRLTCLLHGVVLLGTSGYQMLHVAKQKKGEEIEGGPIIYLLGIAFLLAGYTGTVLGQWIKAAVGRQREYLADASAVQFTRNKVSLVGALKKIGGQNVGSVIESPAAQEYSHAYFANGISSVWQSLNATHPPLEKRIKKIEPYWDGIYIETEVSQPVSPEVSASLADAKFGITAAILSTAEQAISQIGTIKEENIEYVHQLVQQIPASLKNAAHSAVTARAVVYVILIREQKDKTQAWSSLLVHADKNTVEFAMELFDACDNMDTRFKLPLLDICINSLRDLSTNQYIQFERSINKVIILDNKIDLNEWVIQRLVLQQLDEHFNFRKPVKAKYSNLNVVKASAEVLLSLIAYAEHKDDSSAKQIFEKATKKGDVHGLNFIPRKGFSLDKLNESVDDLMQLKPRVKPSILKACVEIILADGKATIKGIELLRTISSCLDSPMPPMRVEIC